MAYAPYIEFERQAWRRFRPDLEGGRFDIVHRITPMSPTLPWYKTFLNFMSFNPSPVI